MTSALHTPQVKNLLETLYTDARENDSRGWDEIRKAGVNYATPFEEYQARKNIYMPVSPEFGNLLYTFIRATGAKTVVEFGTSFGISTTFLAAGVRDNGGGRVITSEFIPEKAETARKNLTTAGLAEYVDFRIGDALETLSKDLPTVDLVLLDGAKELYAGLLKLLTPKMHAGTIVASDNTDFEELQDFVKFMKNPANGYVSSSIATGDRGHHEISVRL